MDKVKEFMVKAFLDRSGLSFVCRNCVWMWQAIERGDIERGCGRIATCGGPMVGRDFPDYKPIQGAPSREQLGRYCFMCGGEAAAVIHFVKRNKATGKVERETYLGVCDKHLPVVTEGWWGYDKDELVRRGEVKEYERLEGEYARVEKKEMGAKQVKDKVWEKEIDD